MPRTLRSPTPQLRSHDRVKRPDNDIQVALKRAFPVRRLDLLDGGSLAYVELPEPTKDRARSERRLLMLGVAGDGYPIAMYLRVRPGQQVTDDWVRQEAAVGENRSTWNPSFGAVLSSLSSLSERLLPPLKFTSGLCDWLEREFGSERHSEYWEIATDYLQQDPELQKQLSRLTGVRSKPVFDYMITASLWQRLYGPEGPDGPPTWVAKLRAQWSVFAPAMEKALGRAACPMREDLSPEVNVLLALGVSAEAPLGEIRRLSRLLELMKPHSELAPCSKKLFDMLRACPEDWWPKDRLSWKAAWRIADAAGVLRSSLRLPMRQLVSPCKGRWEAWCDALARIDPLFQPDEAGGTSNVNLKSAARSVQDVHFAFAAQVYYPLKVMRSGCSPVDAHADFERVFREERERIARVLFGEASMAGILETSVKWHLTRSRLETKMASISPEFSEGRAWEAGLPRHEATFAGRRFEIVPLISQRMLADEGAKGVDAEGIRGLDHCVGGLNYVISSLEGSCRIVSIREIMPDGTRERRSTAEIRYRPPTRSDGARYMMVQHRGHANSTPEDAVNEVLWSYRRGLVGVAGEPKLEVDHKGFAEVDEPLSVSTIAGYSAEDPDHLEAVLRLWEPMLSRPLRGLTLSEFAEACGIPSGPQAPRV